MASKFTSLGYLVDESMVTRPDAILMSALTTEMRAKLTNPDAGMMCYDPDIKGLLYWNGQKWVPVMSQVSTHSIVSVSQDYTVATDVDTVVANAASGVVNVKLPIASAVKGREIIVVKSDSSTNPVQVRCQGNDTIANGTDVLFALTGQHTISRFVSVGLSTWYCV
jgi:hypothetical protein